MGIDVHCEVCGLTVEVEDEREGEVFHCPNCDEECHIMQPYEGPKDLHDRIEEMEEVAAEAAVSAGRSTLFAIKYYGTRLIVLGAVLWVFWLLVLGPIYRFSEDVFKVRDKPKIVRSQE
ncbi:MAG: hypothetical protein ACYTGQ_12555 [Planctomycetota bacterium]|jgi:hypothetical protein